MNLIPKSRLLLMFPFLLSTVQNTTGVIQVEAADHGKPISPNLFGVFFEDLSYAADGVLYAELVQNRSFEYTSADKNGWNTLTGWQLILGEGAKGRMRVEDTDPLNPNNPDYALLSIKRAGDGVALRNGGFDGMV